MPKRKVQALELSDSTARQTPAAKRMKQDRLVAKANALDIESFEEQYVESSLRIANSALFLKTKQRSTTLYGPSTINDADFNRCFRLIQASSEIHYQESSRGWHPTSKQREMRQKEMKYLLVRLGDDTTHAPPPVEGFLSFMLTHDSTPVVPVLYIYEVHLSLEAQGEGLGRVLMDLAEEIAIRVGVKKVMLTCFLANGKAITFYEKMGYKIDECSPQDRQIRRKSVKVDYVIMSKCITDSEGRG